MLDRLLVTYWRLRAALQGDHTPLRLALARPWPGTPRGLLLWLLSLALVVIGAVNYLATDLPPVTAAALAFPLELAPVHVWGWVMVAVAAAGTWSSYCHRGRDRWGYTLMATFCFAWGMGYVTGWLVFGAPLRAIGGSAIWLIFSAVLIVAARFPALTWTDLRDLERHGRRIGSSR